MFHLPAVLLFQTLALPLVNAATIDEERGCSKTRSGIVVPAYTGSLMVDGVLLGEAPGTDNITAEEVNAIIADLDILHMWVGCLEIERGGSTVGVRLISVITVGGAPRVMSSYLEDLVENQEEYRRATGRYAEAVDDLGYLASHPPITLEIGLADAGWTATMRAQNEDTSCVGTVTVAEGGASLPEIAARCDVLEA